MRAVPAEPGAGFQVTITDHSEKGTYVRLLISTFFSRFSAMPQVDDIRLDRDVATELVDGAIVTLGGLRGWAIGTESAVPIFGSETICLRVQSFLEYGTNPRMSSLIYTLILILKNPF